jgi:hypothetical protein
MRNRILIFFTFVSLNLVGQIDDSEIRQIVLEKAIVDSLFVFGEWNDSTGTETHLKYLGEVEVQGEKIKILTSSWYWGLSKRVTSCILFYNDRLVQLGTYQMYMVYDLPNRIEHDELVFVHSRECNCDTNIITKLSFDEGIPEQFFIECKGGYGDLYWFDKHN